ncbi:MAG: hypothetical protein M1813_002747 [Trichoglossum hirsutum]|nr:MAG: hypothetical protein M1813_002747 [Trichoglossum hirsutum]
MEAGDPYRTARPWPQPLMLQGPSPVSKSTFHAAYGFNICSPSAYSSGGRRRVRLTTGTLAFGTRAALRREIEEFSRAQMYHARRKRKHRERHRRADGGNKSGESAGKRENEFGRARKSHAELRGQGGTEGRRRLAQLLVDRPKYMMRGALGMYVSLGSPGSPAVRKRAPFSSASGSPIRRATGAAPHLSQGTTFLQELSILGGHILFWYTYFWYMWCKSFRIMWQQGVLWSEANWPWIVVLLFSVWTVLGAGRLVVVVEVEVDF